MCKYIDMGRFGQYVRRVPNFLKGKGDAQDAVKRSVIYESEVCTVERTSDKSSLVIKIPGDGDRSFDFWVEAKGEDELMISAQADAGTGEPPTTFTEGRAALIEMVKYLITKGKDLGEVPDLGALGIMVEGPDDKYGILSIKIEREDGGYSLYEMANLKGVVHVGRTVYDQDGQEMPFKRLAGSGAVEGLIREALKRYDDVQAQETAPLQ